MGEEEIAMSKETAAAAAAVEIEEYFEEWRLEIQRAENALAKQRQEYAACMREYQACKKIVS
jgi:hypothetical protein